MFKDAYMCPITLVMHFTETNVCVLCKNMKTVLESLDTKKLCIDGKLACSLHSRVTLKLKTVEILTKPHYNMDIWNSDSFIKDSTGILEQLTEMLVALGA